VVRGAPDDILKEDSYTLLSKVGGYPWDTRNSTFLPDAGQRTKLFGNRLKYLGRSGIFTNCN
jgi:hypothetical protein